MKQVTFSREMAPHGIGDTRVVPDEVAEALEKADAISSAIPFPADVEPQGLERPKRQTLKPTRPAGNRDQRIVR